MIKRWCVVLTCIFKWVDTGYFFLSRCPTRVGELIHRQSFYVVVVVSPKRVSSLSGHSQASFTVCLMVSFVCVVFPRRERTNGNENEPSFSPFFFIDGRVSERARHTHTQLHLRLTDWHWTAHCTERNCSLTTNSRLRQKEKRGEAVDSTEKKRGKPSLSRYFLLSGLLLLLLQLTEEIEIQKETTKWDKTRQLSCPCDDQTVLKE